jgi:SAM-dependent methyltransferase
VAPKDDSTRHSSRFSWGNGNRYRLIVVVAASGLGVAGVALYVVEPDRPWVQAWIPSIAGALLVGALTVLVLDIVVKTRVEEARRRQLEPLRAAADSAIQEKVDRFLEKWQYVIGELRGDYPEVVRKEEGAGSFPEPLVSQLPRDTFRLLSSGWGQPNHDRVLARPDWRDAVEIASQVKRQSDSFVEVYSGVLDTSIPAAFGQIQEYLLAAVENMPRTGRTQWFGDEGPHQAFLCAYRTVWPHGDPTLEAARQRMRGIWLAIWQGLREGTSELQVQERDRSYQDPVLVGLYDAINPSGHREDYYLELITSARAVLDLGCGTGRLLKRAARVGDSRVFIGVDRASSMLAEAAAEDDATSWEESQIIWQFGDMRTVDVGRRFDLIMMTGHAFQELLTDGDVRMVLSNVLRHLDPGGRFAFDVHRRGDELWQRLTPSPSAIRVATSSGESVDVVHAPERTVEPDLVEFTTTYTFGGSSAPVVSRSVLRFTDLDHLRALLEDVGFCIDRWFGDWDRIPFTPSGAEDVVVATHIH